MKLLICLLLSSFFLACDGKRNIDEESRQKKVDPEKYEVRKKEENRCKSYGPHPAFEFETILNKDFELEKIVGLYYSGLCDLPKSDDPCDIDCYSPSLSLKLDINNQIDTVILDNHVRAQVSCEKYSGSDCVSHLIMATVDDPRGKKIVENFMVSKMGTVKISGKIGKDEIVENNGDILSVREMGGAKVFYYLGKDIAGNTTKSFNLSILKKENGVETGLGGFVKLALPTRTADGETIDYRSLNLMTKLHRTQNNNVKIQTKVKLLNSKKELPFKLDMELNFEN